MKSLKKLINDDLDKKIPDLRSDIKEEYLNLCKQRKVIKKPFNYKILFSSMSLAMILVIVCLFIVLSPKNSDNKHAIYMLEINPKVAFVVDENDVVINVVSGNEDCDVILSDANRKESLINISSTQAINLFTDYAYQSGYLSDSTKAIRLSNCGNDENVDGIVDDLKDYLCDNGLYVAVLDVKLKTEEFAELLNLDIDNFKNLEDELVDTTKSFVERFNLELDVIYEEIIDQQIIAVNYQNYLKTNKELLNDYQNKIKKIYDLSNQIITHDDNPDFFGIKFDYWTLIDKFDLSHFDINLEFKQLLIKMDQLLTIIKETYNTEIDNLGQLIIEKTKIEQIIFLIDNIDVEQIFENIIDITNVLKAIGANIDYLINLLSKPVDFDDYNSKLNDYFKVRMENNETEIGENDTISKSDYDDFIDGIIHEFGSLENFWQNS